MAVLIFKKFLDFEQVSVDSEMPILGQARLIQTNNLFNLDPSILDRTQQDLLNTFHN